MLEAEKSADLARVGTRTRWSRTGGARHPRALRAPTSSRSSGPRTPARRESVNHGPMQRRGDPVSVPRYLPVRHVRTGVATWLHCERTLSRSRARRRSRRDRIGRARRLRGPGLRCLVTCTERFRRCRWIGQDRGVERIAHVARSFREAADRDKAQQRVMTPDERLAIAKTLRDRAFGTDCPDVREPERQR